MAKLVFRVQADYEEVIKLRNEIAKLKQELKSMNGTQSPAAFKAMNTQLSSSTQRMNELVNEAAKAGAVMEGSFKKKIFDASQSVNGFTEKIIAQKAVIKDIEADVKRLGDAYRIALKRNPLSASGKLDEYNAARKALDEEKAALFGLTQQQAEARLSVKKLRDEYALYKDDAKEVVETNNGIAISWKKALAVIGGAGVLKALGSEMIRVRGEFQAADTAIETLLGNKEKANTLMSQVREFAKVSPLEFSDVTAATQMMLGFNIEAEKVPRFLSAIGDVSMGNTQKFNSLTLAFSQMSATGKLMGGDLNQMINAGFNPLQQISEKTGKSIATLKDEMSKGAISAEMVQQAFIDATSAGGRFYQMSENASKEINGQLSMMNDAIDTVFNELGEKSEGVIMDGIQMTTSLIENYETVGKVLAGLVVTYGTYRTAVMLVTAAESKHTLVEIGLTNARVLARKAQMALNAAMLTNPYVLLAVAVGGLTTAMWAFRDSTTSAEKAQKRFNEQKEQSVKKEQEHKQRLEDLISAIQNEYTSSMDRVKAMKAIKDEYPSLFQKYIDEKGHIKDLIALWKEYNEEVGKEKIKENKSNYSNSQKIIGEYEQVIGLWKRFGEDPNFHKNSLNESEKQLADKYKNETLSTLRSKLDEERNILTSYQKEVRSDELAQWQLGLKENTDVQIKSELDEMKRLQQARKNNKWYSLNVGVGSLKGTTTESELQSRIDVLEAELKSRKTSTYKQDYDKAKKEWEDAKKKLSEIEKDKSKFTSKQYEEAKKREETTEKAYKKLGGLTGSKLTKQENQADKLRKQTDKYNVLLEKQALEQQRSAEDLQMKVDEARIKAMDEGFEKTIAEMELNFEKEMQAIDRQKEDALRKKIEDARSIWETNPKNKGKSFDAAGIKLSDDEQKYFDELYKAAIANNEKTYSDLADKYQSYTDERLAIEKKFNDDITVLQEARKKAEAKGDTDEVAKIDRSIEKRIETKNEDVFKLDAEQFKKSMDWEQVFGNLDKVSTDTLKKLKANLKDFISSQKDLSPENLKELVDAIERIDEKVSERNPFEAMKTSFKSLKDATDAQREAQEAYNKALKEGTDEEKKNAKVTLESAKNNKQKALTEATAALHKGVDEISQYVNAGNEVIGIMETLGLNTPKWLEDTMSGFGEMLDGLGSIDITKPMSIITGGLQTVKGALTSVISLGGLIPGLSGADYSRYDEMKAQYENINSIWDELISKKKEYIDISYGTEALKAGQEALDIIKKSQDAQRNLARTLAQSGASAGSHSIAYRQNAALGGYASELYRYVRQNGNYNDITNALLEASAEQLQKVKEQMPELWAGLDGDFREHLNNIISGAEQAKEVLEQMKEAVAGISFDEFRSGYIDLLSDLDSTNEDFADNFEKYLQKSIFESLLANKYKERIQALYDTWVEYGKDGLTPDEVQKLRDMQEQLSESLLAERDKMMSDFGFTTNGSESKSSTSKGFSAMSQDTGEELNGRFTALQIAGEEIKNQNAIQVQSLNLLTMKSEDIFRVNTEIRNIADDTRDLIAQSYLELVQISENTGAIVKPVIQMQKDIAEVKKNTSKL
jgi:tape measure domain-containing protein